MKNVRQATSIIALAFLVLATVATLAQASDLYLLGGGVHTNEPADSSYSWQLEYRHDLLQHLAAGFSYLNEGHLEGHHRDGYTAQLWGSTELFDPRLTVAAAVGPYFYLDTVSTNTPQGFANQHGFKAMFSAAATWHTQRNILFELRGNLVTAGGDINTATLLAGVGYHFDPSLEPLNPNGPYQEPKNEVTAFVGQTIANSFSSQHSIAAELEYRRELTPHMDWTVGFLHEGDSRLIRQNGLITQLWGTQALVEGMFEVGAGGGAYFNLSHYSHVQNSESASTVSAILTITGSYRITPHWSLRASWNRLVTSYDRDTDLILGGIGYRF